MTASGRPLLLFDGNCGFCHAWVRFVLRHERDPHYHFHSLHSPHAAELLRPHGILEPGLDTIYVLDGGQVFTRSAAALHIAASLRAPWRWLRVLRVIPRSWRDAAYDLVGRWRHRLPGRAPSCALPGTAAGQRIFLD